MQFVSSMFKLPSKGFSYSNKRTSLNKQASCYIAKLILTGIVWSMIQMYTWSEQLSSPCSLSKYVDWQFYHGNASLKMAKNSIRESLKRKIRNMLIQC